MNDGKTKEFVIQKKIFPPTWLFATNAFIKKNAMVLHYMKQNLTVGDAHRYQN